MKPEIMLSSFSQFIENHEGKLGKLYYCYFHTDTLIARVVKFDKLTTYVAEQLSKEVFKLA